MDPGGLGALIGVSLMVFVAIVITVRDRCQKRANENSHLVEIPPAILVEKQLTRKHSSMRDVLKQNQSFSQLKTIRIS